ncbi:MAG: SDR family oxidoreductase [Bacteroidales bacterium]|nr:SDR family oxidoreductase [Bacteroidales bacterium]MBN2764215.1 SDR family oxidoreductase [Bacteroidales bacterium]
MILVIGATGMLGNEICRRLRKEDNPVRAMVRETSDPVKVNKLQELGVEIVRGDLRKSSTFKPVLRDVTTVITTASSMPFSYVPNENDPLLVDRNGMISLVDESRLAGVTRFIYTSFSGQIDLDFPLRNAKRAVEQNLQNNGMVYTILRPSCFMEAWLSPMVGFDAANAKVRLCGEGTKPLSYISLFDVAWFAVESLKNPYARNAVLELGGPEKLSQLDAVKIFEELSGKKFEIEHVPVEALSSQLQSAADPMEKSFAGLMLCVANGDPIDMRNTLGKFNIKLKSVRDFARSMVAVA